MDFHKLVKGERVIIADEGQITYSVKNASSPPFKKNIFKTTDFIYIAIGSITLLLAILVLVFKFGGWKSSIEHRLQGLGNQLEKTQKEIISVQKEGRSVQEEIKKIKLLFGSQVKNESPLYIIGDVGLIDSDSTVEKSTSFGVKYRLEYNICEVNKSFHMWKKLDYSPRLGHFFEIKNINTGIKTWCMVIGTFNDEDEPHRALLISKSTATKVLFPGDRGIILAKIRLMSGLEVNMDNERIQLYKIYRIERIFGNE